MQNIEKSWYHLRHFVNNFYYIEDIRYGNVIEAFSSLDDAVASIAAFEKNNKLLIKKDTNVSYFSRWTDTYEHRQTLLSRLIGGHLDQYLPRLKPTQKIDLIKQLKAQLQGPDIDPAEILYQKTKHIRGT